MAGAICCLLVAVAVLAYEHWRLAQLHNNFCDEYDQNIHALVEYLNQLHDRLRKLESATSETKTIKKEGSV